MHPQLECREQWMRDFVGGEGDVRCFEQLCAQQVTEGVVFFVEGEEGGVCDLCVCALVERE